MPERTPLLAANWKMHKTVAEAERVRRRAPAADRRRPQHDVVDLPAVHLALTAVVERSLRQPRSGSPPRTCTRRTQGAFTGEVSAPMLVELGVDGVVLGHSERRQLFGETDEALARKVPAALAAGLEPILCVGESEEAARRRADRGGARAPARGRPRRASTPTDLAEVVIAYEPIWAIGTGRTATPEQAAGGDRASSATLIAAARRARPPRRSGSSTAARSSPTTPPSCSAQPDIDGALVGGASLDPDDFAAIVEAAG